MNLTSNTGAVSCPAITENGASIADTFLVKMQSFEPHFSVSANKGMDLMRNCNKND